MKIKIILKILKSSCLLHKTHAHTPNQELHMRPPLPRFYHNNTLRSCILSV